MLVDFLARRAPPYVARTAARRATLRSMRFDLRRIRFYEWMLAFLGAVLLGVMFIHWYGVGTGSTVLRRLDAWQAFGTIDVVLAIVGGLAIAVAVAAATHRTAAVPLALAAITTGVAMIATLLVVIRAASPPHLVAGASGADAVTRESGLWLGLVCCIGMVVCGWRSLADEHFPAVMRPKLDVERLSVPADDRPATS